MRIDGALGFFQETSPPNNNKKKIGSDWGPVSGPKTSTKRSTPDIFHAFEISKIVRAGPPTNQSVAPIH